jgi:5-methylcytosine-specific restriction endonuclease McrA
MPTFPKARPHILQKRDSKRIRDIEERAMRAYVRSREKGLCRVCGKPGQDVHEIVARSRGGRVSKTNSVLLCRSCHALCQGHAIRVYGEDAEGVLTFEKVE